jgi:hypothetical protein
MMTVFPLLLAAMSSPGDLKPVRPSVARLASATVTIIQAERIAPALVRVGEPLHDRQISQRDAKPLVEFF